MGAACSTPTPQFAPTASAPASTIAAATASGVAPIIVRSLFLPESNAKETITGSPVLLAAATARRASSMSLMVSTSRASAPAVASAAACAAKAACACSWLIVARHQHLARRTDRGEHQRLPRRRPLRDRDTRAIDRLQVAFHGDRVGAEGVGENDLAARLHVGARHRFHALGMGQVPDCPAPRRGPGRASATPFPRPRP